VPITKRIPTGKNITEIECNLEACAQMTGGLVAAANVLGWHITTHIVDNSNPVSVDAAYQTTQSQHPDGVIVNANAPSATQLNAFAAAGIPVLALGQPESPKYIANLEGFPWQENMGRQDVAFAVSQSTQATPGIGYVAYPGTPATVAATAGMKAGLAAFCPRCQFYHLGVSWTANAAGVSQITNWVRANSGINDLVLFDDAMVAGLPNALRAAGLSNVKIISNFATSVSVPFLQSGQMAAGVGFFPAATGWLMADVFARHFTGMSTSPDGGGNVLGVSVSSGPHVTGIPSGPSGYQAVFRKLWGK
jgi:ABC-type sugar transport system substrate-binding protein